VRASSLVPDGRDFSRAVANRVRLRVSRGLVSRPQVDLVTEPFQALDQIAPQPLRIQAVEVIHPQVSVVSVDPNRQASR
jgi:ABC-type nitrate/sulfonate/bicarbonate transport system ATPase subunit